MRLVKLTICLAFLLTACGNTNTGPATPSEQDIQTAIAQTLSADATNSALDSIGTPETPSKDIGSPQPVPSETPIEPLSGRVNVAFLNLRSGPSTLFSVLQSFEASTELKALRRVPTNDWLEVEISTEDRTFTGWMLSSLLEIDGDYTKLEIYAPPPELIITGRVEDTQQRPINDITIALIYRSDDEEFRTDASSNDEGDFTFYIPDDVLAILDVQIVGIGCDSVIMNINCELEGYFNVERRAFINPPQSAPIIFVYEIATSTLTGTVYNDKNTPVANVLVIAERDDGAETFGSSRIDGTFEIPIGEGTWEVYTVIIDPRLESERTNISVTNEPLAPLELTTP